MNIQQLLKYVQELELDSNTAVLTTCLLCNLDVVDIVNIHIFERGEVAVDILLKTCSTQKGELVVIGNAATLSYGDWLI